MFLPLSLRSARSQLASEANLPGGSAFIEMGASLRRKVWDPVNAFVEGIINSQNIILGEQIDGQINGGYPAPHISGQIQSQDQHPGRVLTTEESGFAIVHVVSDGC